MTRLVLRRVVPASEREIVEGELIEGLRRQTERGGERAAQRWLRRQTWGFVVRAVPVRRSTVDEEEDGMAWLDDFTGDVRWAVRGLLRRPTFTAVAVLTLALGIGANSAIFALVSAHFLRPLPYADPGELVLVWETGRNNLDVNTVAPGNYFDWRDEASSFSDIAAYNVDFATLSGDGLAERVMASLVAPHFFEVLGATPQLGTTFQADEARDADGRQVMLSHGLWTRRYGADPSVIGRDIRIDGRAHTVVGVMPPEYRQPERSMTWQGAELWRPLLLDDQRDDRGSRYLRTVARLSPGVSVEQAREEMRIVAARGAEAYPEQNGGRSILVRTVDEYLLGSARPTLLLLFLGGAAVLLIVCANVANLTLARGEERRREFAVRAALGSGSTRLLRQVIVEGVVLALAGAALGAAAVYAGGGVLQAIQERYFSGLVDVVIDWRVIGFTTLVAVAAGVLFGLPLARSASRPELRGALVEGGERSGAGAGAGATRNLLIIGQVGLATSLLVVATLLTRSFNELVSVPPGFEPAGVLTFEVSPPSTVYADAASILQYHRDLIAELEGIGGVAEVGLISDLMFTTENMNSTLSIDGQEVDPENPPRAELHVFVPEYFDVLDIPMVAGEMPDGWESSGEVSVLVNRRMAEAYWPEGDAIGTAFRFDWNPDARLRVVGIVEDVLDDGYDAVADPAFYIPFAAMTRRRMAYVLQASGDPRVIMTEVRAAVARVDPDIPAGNLMLLEGMLAESVARPRAASLIGLAFALIALLVSAAGIYGVLSYAVQARTREIGIRSALGASGQQIVTMVMGQSTRLVLIGLTLGIAGALLAGRFLASLLFGVRAWDPLSLIGACVVLGTVATLAAWVPARRAVSVDPREALRAD